MAVKKIAKIEVIKAGSNPDIDSDFNTLVRDTVLDHVSTLYGKENVANIITFGSLAAKSAFKTMCTIYEIPFGSANKIASLVPPPIEGVDCTVEDIFNPSSERYAEGSDFRQATSGENWKKIVDGARAIEGRYKSTGVHPCGILVSSEPLTEVIPLQVRQTDGRVISQWTYSECEDVGLIKFDFLGLDTVDLIQHTVEYIQKSGKPVPNMVDLVHGPMDDKKTYEMIAKGQTVGIFQLGSQLVRDFLKVMLPDQFEDIVATTALLRPGPMGMQSHTKYANRKNGKENIESIHPDFVGSPLDEILGKTLGLCVYQEQIMRISNQIAGMTLQEGDDLRKAMGKKKMSIMLAMKPKFFSGAMANGYSEEAVTKLWNTIEEFARYGFNRSHSIAYAMNAYQAAYLKANYPVEFMAALVSQNVGVKEKILAYLQESRKMGLKVGSVDINISEVNVAPDFTHSSGYDIVYGISGVNAVSKDIAEIIVKEREENGVYKSVQDLINRCSPLGVSNRKIYESLAFAGAFDNMGVSRRSIVENLSSMLGEAKTKKSMGTSLFDLLGEEEEELSIDLTSVNEYPFVEKLQKEANVIGLYLTDHPLSRVGTGLSAAGVTPINKILSATNTNTFTVVGSLTEVDKKIRKNGGKTITITADDGSGYITANISRDLVKGIDKWDAKSRIERFYTRGETDIAKEIEERALNDEFEAIPELELNNIYIMSITYRPGYNGGQYGARVNDIKPIRLSDDGKLPIRIRVTSKDGNVDSMKKRIVKFAEAVSKKYPGDYPIHAAVVTKNDLKTPISENSYYETLIEDIRSGANLITEEKKKKTESQSSNIFNKGKEKETTDKEKSVRDLPEKVLPSAEYRKVTEDELSEKVEYFDTGFRTSKTTQIEQLLSDKFGAERIDFGLFNTSMEIEES